MLALITDPIPSHPPAAEQQRQVTDPQRQPELTGECFGEQSDFPVLEGKVSLDLEQHSWVCGIVQCLLSPAIFQWH